MRVIGIDPAPKNPSTLYDGNDWQTVRAQDLPARVLQLAEGDDDLLVCWDSPLTAGQLGEEGCYYERPIERFFRKPSSFETPKGISIRAYAGCPHWAISRASLGLPRLSAYDGEEIPFQLLAAGTPRVPGKTVVEVHPAVAMWLWCRHDYSGTWEYKKDKRTLDALYNIIKGLDGGRQSPPRRPENDDELDAYIAYLLGSLWFNADVNGVILLGDESTGSFLLPNLDGLLKEFSAFPGHSSRAQRATWSRPGN